MAADVRELVEALVSPKVGLIQSIAPQSRDGSEPRPPYLFTATLAHFDFRQVEAAERVGAGKGLTRDTAIASAIGEAVERYCAFQGDPRRTYVAAWRDLAPAAISPSDLVLYSEEQYARPDWPYVRWTDDLPLAWVDGVELPSRVPVAMPAGLTYLASDDNPHFAPSTSNGLAAGATLADALLGALCELMERDTLLTTWMHRLPGVELDLGRSGPLAASLRGHYARRHVEVRAFALPSDLPATTVLALSLEDDPSVPAHVVGLGCHPNPSVALTKALLELCQGRPAEAHRFRAKPPAGRLGRYEDVTTLDDHSAFVSLPERRSEFDFLSAKGAQATVDDLPDRSCGEAAGDVERCVADLVGEGHRVAYADLTLPDVGSLGLHVVRVLATGLQPIHFGWDQERLGGARLFEAPRRLGFSDRVHTPADLNPCPHPLA